MTCQALFTDQWNRYFQFFAPQDVDVYFKEEYVKLYAANGDQGQCFVYQNNKDVFLFPFIKRAIPSYANGSYFDFETAYGYGGPLANTRDPQFLKEALDAFASTALDHHIVAGLVRFH